MARRAKATTAASEATKARIVVEATVARSSTDDIIVDGSLCHALVAETGCGYNDLARFLGVRPETISRMLSDKEMHLHHPLVKRVVRQLVLVVHGDPRRAKTILSEGDVVVATFILFSVSGPMAMAGEL